MWITTNQLGKRIEDLSKRLDRLKDQFNSFKDVVNGQLAALDVEIARLLDKQ